MAFDAQALWAEKYAARFAEQKLAEDTAREQAFVDDVHDLLGERVRGMTPRDMLHLQVVSSPVVYGGAELTQAHVLQFLWAIHTENRGWFRGFRRRRMIKRILRRYGAEVQAEQMSEIADYIQRMFLDAGGRSTDESKPLGACWLAPIMVRLAKAIGPVDPLNGTIWADVPLPRIWQYLKAVRFNEDPKFKDCSPSDKLLSDWLAEVNETHQNGI